MSASTPSSLPSIHWISSTSILVTLVSQALMMEGAIAQSIPTQSSAASSIPRLSFNFVHPGSQKLDGDDRPDPRVLEVPWDLKATDLNAAIGFPFSAPSGIKDSGGSDKGVMHYADANASYESFSIKDSVGSDDDVMHDADANASYGTAPLPLDTLFSGHSDSLVALAIGCAEGTRSPDGGKTWAYNGHTDPGNGVWNMGTFSWQHGATSAEDADRKQLARLRKQARTLTRKAEAAGIPWGLEEQLNALDLANQSPSAALNSGGYIDRLQEAQGKGITGSEAILWARTWSYRHPSGTRWNAPGLGNTHHGIRTDQKRRQDAIKEAIAHFPF